MFSSGLQPRREEAIRCAVRLAVADFSGTAGGVLRAVTLSSSSFPSPNTSSGSSARARGRRRTAQISSSVTTGGGFLRDCSSAAESEWRREGLGLRGGLVLGEGSGLGGLRPGIMGRGICRESLLLKEPDLGFSFQPRGSRPVMTDVITGGEEQGDVEEEEECLGEVKLLMGGQE